jgi:hypothetical protein
MASQENLELLSRFLLSFKSSVLVLAGGESRGKAKTDEFAIIQSQLISIRKLVRGVFLVGETNQQHPPLLIFRIGSYPLCW